MKYSFRIAFSFLVFTSLIAGLGQVYSKPINPSSLYFISKEAQNAYKAEQSKLDTPQTKTSLEFFSKMASCSTIGLVRPLFQPPKLAISNQVKTRPIHNKQAKGIWITPKEPKKQRILYYIHGGAFVFGGAEQTVPYLSYLSQESQTPVFSTEYRLAPEYPFPAAIDDVEAGYRWLLSLGYQPHQIMVAGDSAGGNLALQLMLRLRDAQESLPAGAWLNAPMLDFTRSATTEDIQQTASMAKIMQVMDRCYLGNVSPKDQRVSPLFADLKGLPPLYFTIGTKEGGLGSLARFARIAKRAGVSTTLDVWDGMWHVWLERYPTLPESKLLYQELGQWMNQILKK